ncbi:protein FAM124B [Hyperolius riggenbachi]|uniref:protein FAM124B n=1 Tax=Hyperolius riggenbachi TaxID=752182 RepID=UPI0035A39E40
MDAHHTGLSVTVHLLIGKDDFVVFHQAMDRLLQVLCLDTPLFLVSERGTPVQRYEYQKKRCEIPGISVTLFLREDLGEERIALLQSFFQLPPWDNVSADFNLGQCCSILHPGGDFFCLDLHTPVWGIRRVHYGTEILRVTLYCSCDNYEDAVQLYEMILGMEATSHKFGFCFFVLYSTKHTSIQFSLKQLPPGVSVQVKDACALQFTVQAIGQLVPLLPYPCVPISDTRWQTQDYDGNKILLLVTGSSMVAPGDGQCASKSRSIPFTARISPLAQRTQTTREEEQMVPPEGKPQRKLQNTCTASSQRESCTITLPRWSPQPEQTETNVDTGHRMMNARHQTASVCRLSREIPAPEQSHFSPTGFRAADHLPSVQGDSRFSHVVKQNKGADTRSRIVQTERSQGCHSNAKQPREEFFI